MAIQVTTTAHTDISKAIGSIMRRGKTLDHDIWQTAVNAVAHAQQHGDCIIIGRLYQAMPKGSRRQTLKSWLTEATNITIDNQGKAKFDKEDDRFETPENWNITYLCSVAWYDYKAEQSVKEFGLKELREYLTKLESAKDSKNRRYSSEAKEMAKLLGMAIDRIASAPESRVPESRRLKVVS